MPGQVKISKWQFFVISLGFLIGSSTLATLGTVAGQDAWISQLIAGGLGIFAAALWLSLGNQFSEKLPAEYFQTLAGPVIGTLLSLVYVLFCLHLSALVIRNVTDAYLSTVFVETPGTVLVVAMASLAIISVHLGVESFARSAETITPLVVVFVVLITVLTFLTPGLARYTSLLPMFERGLLPVLKGAFSAFAFPFGETVVMLSILPFVRGQYEAFPHVAGSIAVAAILLSLVAVRNITALGSVGVRQALFPSLLSVQLINIGSFIQRLDSAILFVWTFGSFIKSTTCVFAAALNLKVILKVRDHSILAFPIGSLAATLSVFLFRNTMEMVGFAEYVWPFYALPVQIVLPAIMFILARLRARRKSPSK